MEVLNLALRNIARNRRRSMLTVASLVIGVTMLVNVQALFRGLTTTVYGHMMDMDTAQVQVENTSYRAESRRLPLDLAIEDPAPVVDLIRSVPGVTAVSERIDAAFEITNGVEGARVMARGVSPDEERVTEIGRKIVSGTFLRPGEPGLLLGSGLAGKLGLGVGDAAYFTALDRSSVRNLGAAPVVGIFEFGYPLMDDMMVFLDIDEARRFLSAGESATRLVVRADRPGESAKLATRVAEALHSAGRSDLVAYEWKTFAENLVSSVETRIAILRTVITLLFLLISAGIFNTMAMSVQERYREIGTLRAIGIRRGGLERLFLAEGLALGLAGCLVACLPVTVSGLFLGLWGIDVSGLLPRDIPIPFGSTVYASYTASGSLGALAAALGSAVLGSIVPARRAARMPITEAIGSAR